MPRRLAAPPSPTATTAAPANRSRADWMLRQLAAAGHRLTHPRACVVRAIAAQDGAVTAEQLVADLAPAGVSRATVYRTLELLERHGLLARMHLDNFHAHGYTVCDESHHHHLLCHVCGRVAMVDASGIEAEIRKLAQRLEFRVDTHTLEFSGVCRACQGSGRS
jgi:Fur family ferric uptake transcriptional regulator